MGVVDSVAKLAETVKQDVAGRVLLHGAEKGSALLCRAAFGHASPDANAQALQKVAANGARPELLNILLPERVEIGKGQDYAMGDAFDAAVTALTKNPATQHVIPEFFDRVQIALWRRDANTHDDQGNLGFIKLEPMRR